MAMVASCHGCENEVKPFLAIDGRMTVVVTMAWFYVLIAGQNEDLEVEMKR